MPKGVYDRKKDVIEEKKEEKKPELERVETRKEGDPILTPSSIKKELTKTVCKNCSHEISMHYGSKYDQCNTRDCSCLVLKR